MEKIQTAIQELISELQALKQTKVLMPSLNAIDDCINLAYAKIELEKMQIVDSFEKGYENGAGVSDEDSIYHGGNYYNETFKNK